MAPKPRKKRTKKQRNGVKRLKESVLHINDQCMGDALGYIINYIHDKYTPTVSSVCKHWRDTLIDRYDFSKRTLEYICNNIIWKHSTTNQVRGFLSKIRSVRDYLYKSVVLYNCACYNGIKERNAFTDTFKWSAKMCDTVRIMVSEGILGTEPCCDKFCSLEFVIGSCKGEGVEAKRYLRELTVKTTIELHNEISYKIISSGYDCLVKQGLVLFSLEPTSNNWNILLPLANNDVKVLCKLLWVFCMFGVIEPIRILVEEYSLTPSICECICYGYLDEACRCGDLVVVEYLLNNGFRPRNYHVCLSEYKAIEDIYRQTILGKNPKDLIEVFTKCIPDKEEFARMNGCLIPFDESWRENMYQFTYKFSGYQWGERETVMFNHLIGLYGEDYNRISLILIIFTRTYWKIGSIPIGILNQKNIWNCNALKLNKAGEIIFHSLLFTSGNIKEMLTNGHGCSECMEIGEDTILKCIRTGMDGWIEKLSIMLPFYKKDRYSMIAEIDDRLLFTRKCLTDNELGRLIKIILDDEMCRQKDILTRISIALTNGRGRDDIYETFLLLAKEYINS
jgi:hypothetical protein